MTTMVFSPRPHQRRRSSTPNHNRTSLPSHSPIFHFTPRPTLKRAPRPWDRKPCAPANPFSRNRKVWKRILCRRDGDLDADADADAGANGDGDGDGADMKGDEEGGGLRRGVKRLRIEGGEDEVYVETKWVDAGTRNRKVPAGGLVGQDEVNDLHHSLTCDTDATAACQLNTDLTTSLSAGDENAIEPDIVAGDNGEPIASITIHSPTAHNMDSSVSASIRDEQPATMNDNDDITTSPRLRYSLLEGDLAEVLSDFLTRAKAKRAAGSAPAVTQETENISSDSPKKSLPQSPRTPTRQALGELDQNSPSPTKRALSTQLPSQSPHEPVPAQENVDMAAKGRKRKAQEPAPAPAPDAAIDATEVDVPNAEPARRKTAPARAARIRRNTPKAPNTINLRRAKGTEFVFMQRSEAQQLALTTKANTKKNKGDAQLPPVALPKLQAKAEEPESEPEPEPEAESEAMQSEKKDDDGRKRVRFDEENLVSYCEGEEKGLVSLEDVGLATPSRKRKNREKSTNDEEEEEKKEKNDAEGEKGEKGEKENTPPLPLFSPSVPRKVRRLGPASDTSLLRPKDDSVPGASDERGTVSTTTATPTTPAAISTLTPGAGDGGEVPKEPAKKKVAIGSKRSGVPRPVSASKVKEKKEKKEKEKEKVEEGVMDAAGWKAAARRKGSGSGSCARTAATPGPKRVKREVK